MVQRLAQRRHGYPSLVEGSLAHRWLPHQPDLAGTAKPAQGGSQRCEVIRSGVGERAGGSIVPGLRLVYIPPEIGP